MAAYRRVYDSRHLQADQLRNPTLGSRVWATFTFLQYCNTGLVCHAGDAGDATDAAWLPAGLRTQTAGQRWIQGTAQLVRSDRTGQFISYLIAAASLRITLSALSIHSVL